MVRGKGKEASRNVVRRGRRKVVEWRMSHQSSQKHGQKRNVQVPVECEEARRDRFVDDFTNGLPYGRPSCRVSPNIEEPKGRQTNRGCKNALTDSAK